MQGLTLLSAFPVVADRSVGTVGKTSVDLQHHLGKAKYYLEHILDVKNMNILVVFRSRWEYFFI